MQAPASRLAESRCAASADARAEIVNCVDQGRRITGTPPPRVADVSITVTPGLTPAEIDPFGRNGAGGRGGIHARWTTRGEQPGLGVQFQKN